MGVLINNNTYRQIDNFNTPTSWLLGNVGAWQRLTINFDSSAYIEFSQSTPLFMEEPNRFTLTSGNAWQEESFEIGDNFIVVWQIYDQATGTTTTLSVFGFVTSLQGDVMLSTNTTLGPYAQQSNVYPAQLADQKIFNVFVAANKPPQSLKFDLGHILNSQYDTAPTNSLIDGTKTTFVVDGVDQMTIGGSLTFTPVAPQSGMSVWNAFLSYRNIDNVNPLASGFLKRTYDIDVIFMPTVFFDDTSDFGTLVSPEAFRATECLTDSYEITVSPTQNNPNVFSRSNSRIDAKQGNTGWFNENYNGLADSFAITSLEYRVPLTNSLRSNLDFQEDTLFRATITGIQNLSGQTKCTYGFQWIPNEESEYKDLASPYFENSKMNTGGSIGVLGDVFNVSNTIDTTLRMGYSVDNARMDVTDLRFQQTGFDEITFECRFKPTGDFANFMRSLDVSERNYIIWVGVGDSTKPSNTTDRVAKLLDSNQLDSFIEPIGPYEGMTIDFLTHEQNENSVPSPCGSPILIEDGLLARVDFSLDETLPLPSAIQYGIALQRDADDFIYPLESTPIDLSTYPSVSNYNFSGTKGYKLAIGNDKNFVQVNAYPPLDSVNSKGVRGLYGFKIRWEDWISRGVVPTDVRNQFFDNSLPSDGLSNDWYRYINIIGWSVQFYVYLDIVRNGTPVRYVNKRELVFADYDQNANIQTSVSYFRESTGAPLNAGIDPISGLPLGVVLTDERTRIEITYTRLSGIWSNLNDVYAIATIEVRNGIGAPEYRELSSLVLPESDIPLETPTGLLDLTLVSPTVIKSTCFVNPSKLATGAEYKITGRIK